jgi:hypothetical protein
MRFLNLLLVFVILSGCSSTTAINENKGQIDPNSEIVEAKLIQLKMRNKAGKELPGAGDFYLILNEDEVFIKLMESKVTNNQLTPLINKKSTFRIIHRDGLWDTDDPMVQSRIGPYVVILEIVNK